MRSDQTPGAFWITRPNNTIIGNHVSGSDGFGFWYDLPNHPTGPSEDPTICPVGEEFGIFRDNVSHGNSVGVRVYPQYRPRTESCMPFFNATADDIYENTPLWAVFESSLVYANSTGFLGRAVGTIRIENF